MIFTINPRTAKAEEGFTRERMTWPSGLPFTGDFVVDWKDVRPTIADVIKQHLPDPKQLAKDAVAAKIADASDDDNPLWQAFKMLAKRIKALEDKAGV